jgi:hypothetical protein
MKYSNFAESIEEFAPTTDALNAQESKALRMSVVPAANTPMLAPRRRTLGTRRIQIRDQGLRPFRIF